MLEEELFRSIEFLSITEENYDRVICLLDKLYDNSQQTLALLFNCLGGLPIPTFEHESLKKFRIELAIALEQIDKLSLMLGKEGIVPSEQETCCRGNLSASCQLFACQIIQ